jgi:glycosyltransferase involved in cell wall biosynthesis
MIAKDEIKPMPLKVMVITLDGRIAGPQIRIAEICNILNKNYALPCQVLLPIGQSEKFVRKLIHYNIPYVQVPLTRLAKSFFSLLKWIVTFIPDLMRIKKILTAERPAIVHCNGSWQWKGVLAAYLSKIPIVWHLNDTKMHPIIKMVFDRLKHLAAAYIVEGEKVQEYYLQRLNSAKPAFNIYSPVNTREFDPKNVLSDSQLAAYPGIKIVTVCNVNPYKGLEYLIDCAAYLKTQSPELRFSFIVVGSLLPSQQTYIEQLNQRIRKNNLSCFFFHGQSDNIPKILSAADIYVCSSVSEACPQSVWEAMAMEKPVISTDVGCVSTFLKTNQNGWVIPVKDPLRMAEAIIAAVKNREKALAFGKKARLAILNHLSAEIIAKNQYDCYMSMINNQPLQNKK